MKPVHPLFLATIAEERQRRLDGRKQADPHAIKLWQQGMVLITDESTKESLVKAYNFASNIKYIHGDLPSEIYFAHSVRVAAMAMLSQDTPHKEAGIVGILHNVLEVSTLKNENIVELFGDNVADQIKSLTVDRKIQWDMTYKQAYYDTLNSGPKSARIVKVLDKLDNLFLLGLNPDSEIRHRYLLEIETHIIPMAQREVPSMVTYMMDLLTDCRLTGYFG